MERTFVEVGHRVETQPESRQVSDVTRMARGSGEVMGIAPGRTNQFLVYTRPRPVGALTAATVVGFLLGLCWAIGRRAATGGRRDCLPLEFKTEPSR
jgi:hypothetical protein